MSRFSLMLGVLVLLAAARSCFAAEGCTPTTSSTTVIVSSGGTIAPSSTFTQPKFQRQRVINPPTEAALRQAKLARMSLARSAVDELGADFASRDVAKRALSCDTVGDCPVGPCQAATCDSTTCTCVYFSLLNGASCDDGQYCTDNDFCSQGACRSGPDNPCSSGDACNNQCNELADNCFSNSQTVCDDGLFCNGNDKCDGAGACTNHQGNPCSGGAACQNTCDESANTCNNQAGTSCPSNGLFCDGVERCDGNGNCVSGGDPCPATGCNACNEAADQCGLAAGTACGSDNDDCTDDVCDGSGSCTHPPSSSGTSCNDGNSCTTSDVCDGSGTCAGTLSCTCTQNSQCDDGNACTSDACNAGSCVYTFVGQGSPCDDNQWCNGADTCNAVGQCNQHAGSPCGSGACDSTCTENAQNPGAPGSCNAASGTPCADSLFCNGAETCDGNGACVSPGDPCAGGPSCNDVCDEAADSCQVPAGTSCDDGVWCNGVEVCNSTGFCVSGSAPCAPGTPCNSTCNEVAQDCAALSGTACDDGVWCNGHDICSAGVCEHIRAPCTELANDLKNSCLDGCNETDHTCAKALGDPVGCLDTVNRSDCSDGQFCNGAEVCDGLGGVISVGNPCAEVCDAGRGVCLSANSPESLDSEGGGSDALGDSALFIGLGLVAVCLLCCCLIAAFLVIRRQQKRGSDSGAESVELEQPGSVRGTLSPDGKTAYAAIDTSGGNSPVTAPGAYGGLNLSADATPANAHASVTLSPHLASMLASSKLGAAGGKWQIPYEEVTIENQIGAGSFGTVYAGMWRGGKVAIKTIQGNNFSQADLDDFMAEAEVMSGLRPHANVVQFFGVSFGEIGVCILTEFMRRGGLEDLIDDKSQDISPEEMLQWIRGIASGMQHLSAENIVHRDLAARNVLLGDENSVKIADFGMARELTMQGQSNTTKSNTGPLKHMAVESLLHRTYSTKSDVWAFAVTVAEILTRDEPFPDLDAVGAATQVTHGLRVQYPENIDPSLHGIVTACMQDDPAARPDFATLVEWLSNVTSVWAA